MSRHGIVNIWKKHKNLSLLSEWDHDGMTDLEVAQPTYWAT